MDKGLPNRLQLLWLEAACNNNVSATFSRSFVHFLDEKSTLALANLHSATYTTWRDYVGDIHLRMYLLISNLISESFL